MSQFTSKLVVEDDDGFPFVLKEPLVYQSDGLRTTLTIPAGFKTDFASIPRVLWNILAPVGSYDRAAVVHDLLYQQAPKVPSADGDFNSPARCSRKQADDTLLEAMEVCGTGRVVRWAIYAGVRAGGWKVWNAYRAKDSK